MRMILVAAAVLIAISAPAVRTENPGSANGRCECCGKFLGKEVPESPLSSDPDFKQNNMFQVCQICLDKKMDRRTQDMYAGIARKYKWNSINHNRSLAFRYNRKSKM